jgi:hypothetical protein
MTDDSSLSVARDQVLTAVTERNSDFSLLEAQLAALRAPILVPPLASPPSAASIQASLPSLLQECLPPPPAASWRARDKAASHWWYITKSEIQKLRRLRISNPAYSNPLYDVELHPKDAPCRFPGINKEPPYPKLLYDVELHPIRSCCTTWSPILRMPPVDSLSPIASPRQLVGYTSPDVTRCPLPRASRLCPFFP